MIVYRTSESLKVLLAIILKLITPPIGGELRLEALKDVRHVLSSDLDGPLQALSHRRMRHVRRAHIGRRVASISDEVVGLGVESRAGSVVGDAHTDVGLPCQPFKRLGITGAHVTRRNDAHRYKTVGEAFESGDQQPQS